MELEVALKNVDKDTSIHQKRVDHAETRYKKVVKEHAVRLATIKAEQQAEKERLQARHEEQLQLKENEIARLQLEHASMLETYSTEKRQMTSNLRAERDESQAKLQKQILDLDETFRQEKQTKDEEMELLREKLAKHVAQIRQRDTMMREIEAEKLAKEDELAALCSQHDLRMADLLMEHQTTLAEMKADHANRMETKEQLITTVCCRVCWIQGH